MVQNHNVATWLISPTVKTTIEYINVQTSHVIPVDQRDNADIQLSDVHFHL